MNKYTNPYTQERYEAKKALCQELNQLGTPYKFELIEDETNDGREYIALNGIVPVAVNYNEYQKDYNFYLNYTLPYVRYDTEKLVKEKYQKPNDIHKLHKNKVIAWVEYLVKIWEELVAISGERVAKINEFEARLKKEGATFGKKDCYGAFEGKIVRNGLEFRFTVHNEGYISQDIEIYYQVKDNLESFLKLSNNEYKQD